ncbi:MAG: tetratricopeptide repeat protein, partial [Stellaceae bacterium]
FAVAAACFLVAAQAGNRAAQFDMGAMYDNGRGVAKDVASAVMWYRRAAEQGDGRAAYALGLIYQEGGAVPTDRREALKWFLTAERDGIAAAKGKIAALAGPAASPKTAVREPGIAEYRHGFAFLTGQGEPQDSAAAFRWFSQGARAGADLAAYALADLYERGEGIERDDVKASAWSSVAAREAPAGERLRAAALRDAARVAARLTSTQRAAAAKETRDILAELERERSNAAVSSGSSRR